MLQSQSNELPPRMIEALAQLETIEVDGTTKGMPGGTLALGQIGTQGWNILRGDLPLPLMLLKREALANNITLMQAYCDRNGGYLAPHGKTPMSPQIWALQLQAGAWAISVSTIQQFEVAHRFGVPRILLANQVVGTFELNRIAAALSKSPAPELYLVVDSLAGIELLEHALNTVPLTRSINVLVEYGARGARAGVRDISTLVELAFKVRDAGPGARLAGVFGYEGMVPGANFQERSENVEAYLAELKNAVQAVRVLVPEQSDFIVSAGGSIYFDRVAAHLGRKQLPEAQLVLRPGAYVTHDSAFYERISPLAKSSLRFIGGAVLQPTLEIWSHVLSRPERELVILGMGGRDAPWDLELPLAIAYTRGETIHSLAPGHAIVRMNDQHAFLRVPPDSPLVVGDRVICGISHPCATFDKWRQIFLVEKNYTVTGAIQTYF